MPLTLTIPTAVNQMIDTLEINSFAVDIEAHQIHIAWDEGYIDNAVFVPVTRDKMITISGSDFAAALAEADAANTGSVYGDLKTALYSRLMIVTGVTGTVS